ncbi:MULTISPECIES: AraC family transcriptional regulator [Bacillus]|uniref:AraC family transcriptional regulator n=1 Tax=Bacillus capparidis TaxID=1840411 RepID=A0ABS4CXF8_9BACI|nr:MULTISPECIES: AraC family transcriptional regulator [Bacillus]MBP1081926.1 AraC family transcriptional regulator [Bacillus capparidis]MED1096572.1 AraC family transcriptional regulator [Bacillus capparidis]
MIDFDQQQRIHIGKVMKYIEQNLDQKLSLEQLAKVSSYSQFHFHRIFTGLIGETPSDYVKRIRMEKAGIF